MKLLGHFTLLAFLSGAFTAKAAIQCSSALLTPPTQEQVKATLDALARLTLEVDLAKSKSTETKSQLESDLALKQNEVMKALDLDRSSLSKQLRPRIQELQKIKKSSTKESTRRRQTEKKNLVEIPIFKKTMDIKPPKVRTRQVLTAKLPEMTTLVNSNGGVALYTHNIATNHGDWISGHLLAANISGNKKNIYGINSAFEILTFRPGIVNSVKPPTKIKDSNNQPWKKIVPLEKVQLEVSPGEKLLALHIGDAQGELYIIRIADGEVLYRQETGFEFGAKFRSDEEIYIFDAISVVKRNLSTQHEVKVENLGRQSNLNALWLDPKGENLIHVSSSQMTVLDPLTLEVKSSQAMAPNGYTPKQMPGSDRYYLATYNNLPEIFDYTQKIQDPLFSFDKLEMLNMAFTDDGNSILFFNIKNFAEQLSIWTREN